MREMMLPKDIDASYYYYLLTEADIGGYFY